MERDLLDEFLGPLHTLFRRSRQAYDGYRAHGQSFLFARIIKECNEAIRDLLLRHAHRLPGPLQDDALALIGHYDVWTVSWNDLRDRINPGLDQAFVFETLVGFPKEAERRLESYYEQRVAESS